MGLIEDRLAANTGNMYREVMDEVAKTLYKTVLEHTRYNLSATARILGISITKVQDDMKRLGFKRRREQMMDAVNGVAPYQIGR